MTVIFSGLFAALISLSFNYIFYRKNNERTYDEKLMELNSIVLDNPSLENDASLEKYLSYTKTEIEKEELNDKYNIFCIMKFNYLENFCLYYDLSKTRISKKIHVKEMVIDHKNWWDSNRKINYESYDKKFIQFIEDIVNET